MNSVSLRGFAVPSVIFGLLVAALFAFAPRAGAAELLFWNNYRAEPQSVGFANLDGSGGGPLNLAGVELDGPEGMALDSATGRLYVAAYANGEKGQIIWINIDGSGAGVLNTGAAPVDEPMGIGIDPATRTVYWVNTAGPGGESDGSIGWANLDNGVGGELNTSGATFNDPYRGGIDPVGGRIYWGNSGSTPNTISYANFDNSGGGNLDLTGATPPVGLTGFATDPVTGRLYWLDNDPSNETDRVSFASLTGGGGGDVNTAGGVFDDPYGLAIDPAIGRFYWGNYGKAKEGTNAIGFVDLSGGGGGISIPTAPADGPQDPLILKSPSGTSAPVVSRDPKNRAALTCSQGGWGADFAGSYVYQAPRTLAYLWTRNGQAIAGATAPTFTAASAGSYGCAVTAANQAGSATQASAPATVKASIVKLTVKPKKAEVKPGSVAKFTVKAVNQGDLPTRSAAKICAKVPKKARKDLKAPKCKKLGKLKSRGKRPKKVKVKVGKSAEGTYKVTFRARGSKGKPATATLKVAGG